MDDRVSELIRNRAQRNHTLLLQGMAAVSQKRVAELIGVSTTTMSDMKAEHLERFSALVAACGLKFAKVTDVTYDESYVSALKTLASVALGRQTEQPRDEVGE
jgi:predicted XRE-type DNA-binding protein